MAVAILATKLFIPSPRAKIVLRPRLIERLNEGLHRPSGVMLVSAPAGFGKTTLLSEWVNDLRSGAANDRVAWLALDEGDSDLSRFLAYLVAALQTIAPDVGASALAMLQASQPLSPPTEPILTALLNEIADLAQNFILVLDDYHVIESALVDQALTFLVDHLPPRMHLIIATRVDPDLPLARYRVRGQLIELRAADLRFTAGEAAEFLNETMGLRLSARDVAALETRTEGWIAGLQLAALSMQGERDTAGFIQAFTGSHHFVLDYLVEEVLEKQSENIQMFLLHTSMLERMCGPLCDAVLLTSAASASGQETLEYLERVNLFIVPLDNERRWYRYHHLFADLLLQRLHRSTSVSEGRGVTEYHRRASLWYEQNGYPAEAFQHAVAAGDFERAATVAELSWQGMDRSFQSAVWLGWVKKLPDELVRHRPALSTQYAQALMDVGELEAGESRLRDAERWLEAAADGSSLPKASSDRMVVVDPEQFRALPISIALSRAYLAQARSDFPGIVKYANLALALSPEGDEFSHGAVAASLSTAYWANGDLEAAHRAMTDWVNIQRKLGNIVFAVASTFVLADLRVAQGRLREAAQICQQSLRLAAEHEEQVERVTSHLHLGLAMLYHEMGDQQASSQYLLSCQELGKRTVLPDWPWRWRLAQARLKESTGEYDSALDLLDEANRLYVRVPLPDIEPIPARKARVYVRQGRLAEAFDWVNQQGLSIDDELSYLHEFEHITLAKVLVAQYKSAQTADTISKAKRLLTRLLKAAEEGGRMGNLIEILIVQALAHQTQEDITRALESLERALTLAQPEGYTRIFLDEGTPMAKLLTEAAAHGIMPEYIARLLAVRDSVKHQSADNFARFSSSPAQPLIEPLSQRELEVLRLVAQGLSNGEISKRLFLSLSTVKGHNLRIFAKLQAHSRTEAVARARELGLL
jgi:LuxR family transcriptional regulator, maltose regulon positive regulatory protein